MDNINALSSIDCFKEENFMDIFLSDAYIKSNVDSIKSTLKINKNMYFLWKGLNHTYLETSRVGEMFIYLNLCPKYKYEWTIMLTKLFQNAPPSIIVQTLNRILETAKLKKDKVIVVLAEHMMEKVAIAFSMKFNIIENIVKGTESKGKVNIS